MVVGPGDLDVTREVRGMEGPGAGGDANAGGPGRAALHVFFSGIVQGVFFRASTKREAVRLGLQGWVRNLPDGRVEAWVEGERPRVEELLDFCTSRIPMASVERVEFDWRGPSGEFSSFEVVR
jgi:acylphosphatase